MSTFFSFNHIIIVFLAESCWG